MALKTFVKISNITNLSDARYCAGMMVDVLGFDLTPSSRDYVSPEKFSEITSWVAGVKFAGEFGKRTLGQIKQACGEYELDIVETAVLENIETFAEMNYRVYFKLYIAQPSDLDILNSLNEKKNSLYRVVIDCVPEMVADFERVLPDYAHLSLIKAYDVSLEHLDKLEHWFGVQLEGTPEERPGFKDYGAVMDILEELEEED